MEALIAEGIAAVKADIGEGEADAVSLITILATFADAAADAMDFIAIFATFAYSVFERGAFASAAFVALGANVGISSHIVDNPCYLAIRRGVVHAVFGDVDLVLH